MARTNMAHLQSTPKPKIKPPTTASEKKPVMMYEINIEP